ncbi:unnamed protein product [Gordionus sp. m RMFG-2023]
MISVKENYSQYPVLENYMKSIKAIYCRRNVKDKFNLNTNIIHSYLKTPLSSVHIQERKCNIKFFAESIKMSHSYEITLFRLRI